MNILKNEALAGLRVMNLWERAIVLFGRVERQRVDTMS
jgi:hypothetical protein